MQQFSANKWKRLLLSPRFWSRFVTLFLSMLLQTLSVTYCVAQCYMLVSLQGDFRGCSVGLDIRRAAFLVFFKGGEVNDGLCLQDTKVPCSLPPGQPPQRRNENRVPGG